MPRRDSTTAFANGEVQGRQKQFSNERQDRSFGGNYASGRHLNNEQEDDGHGGRSNYNYNGQRGRFQDNRVERFNSNQKENCHKTESEFQGNEGNFYSKQERQPMQPRNSAGPYNYNSPHTKERGEHNAFNKSVSCTKISCACD